MSEKVGKSYKGQKFAPITTEEEIRAVQQVQEPFNKEGAVPLEVWFSMHEVRDPVKQAAMRAYTKVRRATPDDWDNIFKTF